MRKLLDCPDDVIWRHNASYYVITPILWRQVTRYDVFFHIFFTLFWLVSSQNNHDLGFVRKISHAFNWNSFSKFKFLTSKCSRTRENFSTILFKLKKIGVKDLKIVVRAEFWHFGRSICSRTALSTFVSLTAWGISKVSSLIFFYWIYFF